MRWYGDAPFGPDLAAMPDTRYAGRCALKVRHSRIYTKTADAFNTEDVTGDMAADESCESGE